MYLHRKVRNCKVFATAKLTANYLPSTVIIIYLQYLLKTYPSTIIM